MATCTSFLDGARCILDADHPGLHQVGWEGEIPDDVSKIIATVMQEAEEATTRAGEAYRRYRIAFRWMVVAGAVNIGAALAGIIIRSMG